MDTDDYLKMCIPLSFFAIVGFFIKIIIDAFASNVNATSSIVQHSLMIMYLASILALISYYFTKNARSHRKNTNFWIFLGALFMMLCNSIGIVSLNGMYLDILNRGNLIPSVNDPTISNWVLVPQVALILYNLSLFLQCDNPACPSTVSWVTLTIIALTLIQMYLIVNSFRVMQTWPTDDSTRNIPSPTTSA